MRAEHDLALNLMQIPMRDANEARARELIPAVQDWDALFAFTETGWVEPAVLGNLVRAGAGLIPSAVLDRAKRLAVQARAAALTRTLLMNQLASKFSDAAISVIVIKGPALGVTAYGDPALRSFGDIDLLVQRDDLPRARDCLIEWGFSPLYERVSELTLVEEGHALEFTSPNLKVELHCDLISRYLRVPFDQHRVWSTARSIECAGREIPVLASDIQFVFICAHGAKHEWMQLRLICDVAQLLDRMGDDEATNAAELAASLNARRLVAIAVRAAQVIFSLKIPQSLEELVRGEDVERTVQLVRRNLEISEDRGSPELPLLARIHPALQPLFFWMNARERLRDRMAAAGSLLLHSSSNTSGRLAGIHPLRLARRAFRRLRTVR
jgi:hypothetical protein